MQREEKTLRVMVAMYCRARHGTRDALCDGCTAFLAYAQKRLDHCPMRPAKPPCSECPVHCYATSHRETARRIMAYAGPRMLLRHPYLALCHVIDGWRARKK